MKQIGDSSLIIQNIVSSGSIAASIDLELISDRITGCKLNKEHFPGAVYHMQNPKSVALIFASGRIVLTGLLSHEDIPAALQNLLNILKTAGVTCHDNPQIAVKNIVCTYNLGYPCNLVRILTALMDQERVEYEPESFPGLVCRISDPKVVFLLFSSGKIVITGGTTMPDIKRGLGILMDKLSIVGNIA
jgi:transcription initiation factor TFIID TATA-box-binding protein